MASLNKVFLIGNLTRDPELRYTASGAAVADLGLAVNRRYTNGGGELKEDVLFVTVVAWGKQAEAAAQYLAKGAPIHVEGRLQSRSWETKDGEVPGVSPWTSAQPPAPGSATGLRGPPRVLGQVVRSGSSRRHVER